MHVASFHVAPAPEPGKILVTVADASGREVPLFLTPAQGVELGLLIKDTACLILEKSAPWGEDRTHFVTP